MDMTKEYLEKVRQETALRIRNEILLLIPKMKDADDDEFYHLINKLDEKSELYRNVKYKKYK